MPRGFSSSLVITACYFRPLMFVFAGVAILLAQETSATVSGELRDGTGAGLPRVNAELAPDSDPDTVFSARTDDKGRFRFAAVPSGTFTLNFVVPGAQGLRVNSIQVAPGEQKVLPPLGIEFVPPCGHPPVIDHLRLVSTERAVGNLSGRVMRDQDHPIAQATVKLLCTFKGECRDIETKTNADGGFQFLNRSPAFDYTLYVAYPGFDPWQWSGFHVQGGYDITYRPALMEPGLPPPPLVFCN
jgi:hypothetical protein